MLTHLTNPGLDSWVTFNTLRSFLGAYKLLTISEMSGGWTTALVAGGNIPNTKPTHRSLAAGGSANGSALSRTAVMGMNSGGTTSTYVDWDKDLSIFVAIAREVASDAQAVGRVQLKSATTIGALGAKGIGLQMDNLALTGEAYGTSLGTVDLSTTMTLTYDYWIEIRLESTGVTFLVNNVSKGTITTAGKFPTGMGVAEVDIVISHANGAAGTDSQLTHSPIILLQEV